MYTFGIYIYALFVRLAALLGHRKAKRMVTGHREIFPTLKEKLNPEAEYV